MDHEEDRDRLTGNLITEQWTSQVLSFFYSVWPLVVGFGLLELAASVLFDDPGIALVGATLVFLAALMLVCRWITTRGGPRKAVALMCGGFLLSTLFVALVAPTLAPTLALTPFLAFGLVLPFFDDSVLKWTAVAVWVCSVLAVGLADPVLGPVILPFGPAVSTDITAAGWYAAVFRLASVGTASGVVLMVLWRFRAWINDHALARVRETEERYALVERGSNDGLWDWDIAGRTVYLSARFCGMLGLDEVVYRGPAHQASWLVERVHPEDRETFRERVRGHLDGASEHFESEHRVLHEDGAYRWMLVRGQAVLDAKGGPVRMAGSQTDVTRRRSAEQSARHDSLHDSLTGLPNRKRLSQLLSSTLSRRRDPEARPFSLLFVDLDRFKSVNDSLGHGVGDDLLVAISRRITSRVSARDTVVRLGGDEFVVLLDGSGDQASAERTAQRLIEVLEDPFIVDGHRLLVTASIGVLPGGRPDPPNPPESADTLYTEARAGRAAEGLIRDADAAMYHAKAAGKSRYATFEPRMRDETLSDLSLEDDLRGAIANSQFTVAYQPIVWLASGEVVGFEALLRWQHPGRGQVPPQTFVPLAEELGLVDRIDRAVLGEACRTIASLRGERPDGYPVSVSVNLSASHLDRPGLIKEVAAALVDNGLPGEALKLEITETSIMADFASAAHTLSRLKALGVGLHIDDFGTGHSSLALLHRLPADALKIDRSFTGGLSGTSYGVPDGSPNGSPTDNDELVSTIVSLGHQLGLEVVAEGVETGAQLERLRALGCDYAQGYRFSGAVSSLEASVILQAEPRW